MLVRTVTANFGIPIHHYIEVNFQGFKDLVNAIGGVTLCAPYQARDTHIGLWVRKGCNRLTGIGALRYARSRHYQQRIKGEWVLEGTGDIGRSARQREFITLMLRQAAKYAAANPFKAGDVIHAVTSTVTVDANLDMPSFLKSMRPAADGNIANFGLEVYQDTEAGMAVVKLGGNSKETLAFFAGVGPPPAGPSVPAG
jgi:LCP family protein required for cell wall assembly